MVRGAKNVSSSSTESTGDAPAENHRSSTIDHCQSFEALAEQYNFLNFSSYGRVFTSLILGEIAQREGLARVLDIGCGRGIGRNVSLQEEVRSAAGEFWGIEPDESIQPEEGQYHNFQHALLETAELPENHFDVAYSSMVMEHVGEPDPFLKALDRSLKPGGVYLFVTPNVHSFVPRVTQVCHKLGVDEMVLRLTQGSAVDEYHYPVRFLFNSPKLIDRASEEIGFQPPEYAYIEGKGGRHYFPGPLKLIYSMIAAKRKLIKNPERLSTMICRITKPQA